MCKFLLGIYIDNKLTWPGIITWGSIGNSSLINKAIRFQDKFIETITNYSNATELNYIRIIIYKINDIMQLQSCKFMYKINNHLLPIELGTFFSTYDTPMSSNFRRNNGIPRV